ncbi:hypothetical protein BWQ96_04178 [Gracilariopsis chorda]|uniref:Uncharacterized protein n=1 Tax=Gracilariopsis chorda TaxID=448386 RepID=A0A2V3IVA8_9FLOR|nr:hypothetical protein BWQ96_04178 [Gracilariopsis chorda]|eukprot:PXF46078.1 hypothetical protein BWQ96_04178 [Gracilariopsis chorda]
MQIYFDRFDHLFEKVFGGIAHDGDGGNELGGGGVAAFDQNVHFSEPVELHDDGGREQF